jgi:hypothetical protein
LYNFITEDFANLLMSVSGAVQDAPELHTNVSDQGVGVILSDDNCWTDRLWPSAIDILTKKATKMQVGAAGSSNSLARHILLSSLPKTFCVQSLYVRRDRMREFMVSELELHAVLRLFDC